MGARLWTPAILVVLFVEVILDSCQFFEWKPRKLQHNEQDC